MKIERLITKGIQQKIPIEVQILLWNMQDKLRKQQKEIDYLQIYRLETVQQNLLFIKHTAEQAFLSNVLLLCCRKSCYRKNLHHRNRLWYKIA